MPKQCGQETDWKGATESGKVGPNLGNGSPEQESHTGRDREQETANYVYRF